MKLGGGGSSEGGLGGLLGTITRSIGTLSTKATAPKKGPKDPRTVSDKMLQQQQFLGTYHTPSSVAWISCAKKLLLRSTAEAVQQRVQ
jgi:hypothetical protein